MTVLLCPQVKRHGVYHIPISKAAAVDDRYFPFDSLSMMTSKHRLTTLTIELLQFSCSKKRLAEPRHLKFAVEVRGGGGSQP